MATDSLEVRMAHLEGAYEQIDKRLGALEGAVQSLRIEIRQEIQQVRQEIQHVRSELLSRMDRQFFWILGLLVVSILLPVAMRLVAP